MGCKRTHKSFDLSKIWEKLLKIYEYLGKIYEMFAKYPKFWTKCLTIQLKMSPNVVWF